MKEGGRKDVKLTSQYRAVFIELYSKQFRRRETATHIRAMVLEYDRPAWIEATTVRISNSKSMVFHFCQFRYSVSLSASPSFNPAHHSSAASAASSSWPQSAIHTLAEVLPFLLPSFSIFLTTSIPSTTCPKTTWAPSSHDVTAVQMKNWLPLVLGPALAMDRIPGPVCFSLKFSSLNFMP